VVSSYWCVGVCRSWHEGNPGRAPRGVDVTGRRSWSPYPLPLISLLLTSSCRAETAGSKRLTQHVTSSGAGRRAALACGVERSPEEYEGGVLLGGASSAVGTRPPPPSDRVSGFRSHGLATERTRCLAPPRCLAPLRARNDEKRIQGYAHASSTRRPATVLLLLTPHSLLPSPETFGPGAGGGGGGRARAGGCHTGLNRMVRT
jgi:hypothetical protein